jgi:hypothetical protein
MKVLDCSNARAYKIIKFLVKIDFLAPLTIKGRQTRVWKYQRVTSVKKKLRDMTKLAEDKLNSPEEELDI